MVADKKLSAVERGARGIVLAEGEVTGHAHRIVDDGAVLMSDGETLSVLEVERKVALTHEEHKAIDIEPGSWEVRRQREYTIFGERRVLD